MGREIAFAAFLGIAIPLACQFGGPLAALGPEFTQLFTLVSAIALFGLAARVARTEAPDETMAPRLRLSLGLTRAVWVALVLGCVALVTMAVANEMGPRCRLQSGLILYWITWTPAAALACVLGVAAGARGWARWRIAGAVVVLLALDVGWCVGSMALGVPCLDPIVGKPLFIDVWSHRLNMPTTHKVHRVAILVLAFGIWQVVQWRSARTEAGRRRGVEARIAANRAAQLGIVLAGVAAVALVSGALDRKPGRSRGSGSGTVVTEHVTLHYPVGWNAGYDATILAREAEWLRARLTGDWGIEDTERITVRVYESGQMHHATGLSNAHASGRTIHIESGQAIRPIYLHEMVHVLQPRGAGLWAHRRYHGLFEGLAEAYEQDFHAHPHAHHWVASRMRAGQLASAREVLSGWSFLSNSSSDAYEAAGSFAGFLILEFGIEAYFELLRDLDFDAAYGEDLESLDARWKRFLGTLPACHAEVASVRRLRGLANPGYLCDPCRKLGTARPTEEMGFWGPFWDGNYEDARQFAQQKIEGEDSIRWSLKTAMAMYEQEQFDDVEALIEDTLARDYLSPDERYALLYLWRDNSLRAGRWDELAGVQDRIRALGPFTRNRYLDQILWQWVDEEPNLIAEIGTVMALENADLQKTAMQELHREHPSSQAIHALAVYLRHPRLGFRPTDMTDAEGEALLNWLAEAHQTPGVTDAYGRSLMRAAENAIHSGEVELAEAICTAMGGQVVQPLLILKVQRCLERVEWERE